MWRAVSARPSARATPLALLFGFNPTRFVLGIYFH
jgi:hypothetical protein